MVGNILCNDGRGAGSADATGCFVMSRPTWLCEQETPRAEQLSVSVSPWPPVVTCLPVFVCLGSRTEAYHEVPPFISSHLSESGSVGSAPWCATLPLQVSPCLCSSWFQGCICILTFVPEWTWCSSHDSSWSISSIFSAHSQSDRSL